MNSAWIALLGWILVGAGAVTSLPQITRLARTRNVDGLSPTAELVWVMSWALWLWYVIDLGLWPRIVSEGLGLLVGLVTTGLLLASLHRHRGAWPAIRTAAPVLVAGLAGALAARALWGLNGWAIALTLLDVTALAPLIRTTLRAPSLAGVSAWSWALKGTVYSGWIVYAIAIGNPLSAGWTFLMAPVAVFMLARIAADRDLLARGRAHAAQLRDTGGVLGLVAPIGSVRARLRRG